MDGQPPGDRDEHYFTRDPTIGSARRSVRLSVPGMECELLTDRGVFSGDRIDPGTRFLLQEAPRPDETMRNICDLGCGYGPIAVSLARWAPWAQVWAVDVNDRAVGLCRDNATSLGLGNLRATLVNGQGMAVEPESNAGLEAVRFDALWSNPPIRIGKPALHALLARWLDRLAPTGRAWLVVQRHLGADSLAEWLTTEGWPTRRLGSRAGYRLLEIGAG